MVPCSTHGGSLRCCYSSVVERSIAVSFYIFHFWTVAMITETRPND
jgi:hypothetical protein